MLSIMLSISNVLSSPDASFPSVDVFDTVSDVASGSASKPAIGSVSSSVSFVGLTIESAISAAGSSTTVSVSFVGVVAVIEVVTSTESAGVSTSAVPLTSTFAVSGSAEIASTIDL